MSFLICLFVIEKIRLIKKNLKTTNCAVSAFLGKWVLCIFYLFYFQFTFAQLYQSRDVKIVGISQITIVPSKDQIGNVYVSKGASIYNAENITSTKIIVLKNPQKKAIFKEELATTNKTRKSEYSKEITALEKKPNFNFIGGKSDEAIKSSFESIYAALQSSQHNSKSTPNAFFEESIKILLKNSNKGIFYKNIRLIHSVKSTFKTRPPPSVLNFS
ncbi:hypothetical protein G6R40_02945 [Chryseobacterium sp. POL2]|uniref:hypothetical protein n=1 Tax=Chryseobacterium sp. POL2 TaxID=2713414 RepID=UPI0013E10208|nr:hypothetical protein [Chryseobacterium sp. POL2]QIG88689.1 hypothetical protein G6R40_02945 [Chryseobacterium sp. POL2]